jgi:hypothetical protein
MAKKRRKTDKIRAQKQLKKRAVTQKLSTKLTNKVNVESKIEKEKIENLFNYDPGLIGKDLKKTLLITLVVLLVLALVSLRYT